MVGNKKDHTSGGSHDLNFVAAWNAVDGILQGSKCKLYYTVDRLMSTRTENFLAMTYGNLVTR